MSDLGTADKLLPWPTSSKAPTQIRWSPTRGKLAAALAKAHAAVAAAHKDADNPFFKSKYADLATVVAACKEALTSNGIAFPQPAWTDSEGRAVVTTCLIHESGEWMESDLAVKPKDPGPQALGSCITYLRRYGLAAAAGVAPEDDDGEASEGRGPGVHGAQRESATPSSHGASGFETRPGPRTLTTTDFPVSAEPAEPIPNWNELAQALRATETQTRLDEINKQFGKWRDVCPVYVKRVWTQALKRIDTAKQGPAPSQSADPADRIPF
jgi:ERF superfamily protein